MNRFKSLSCGQAIQSLGNKKRTLKWNYVLRFLWSCQKTTSCFLKWLEEVLSRYKLTMNFELNLHQREKAADDLATRNDLVP